MFYHADLNMEMVEQKSMLFPSLPSFPSALGCWNYYSQFH